MKKIKFNTGRCYGPEGQEIEAEEFNGPYDAFDFDPDTLPENDPYVIFNDLTRGITGKIKFCRMSQSDIMRNYDEGNYSDI